VNNSSKSEMDTDGRGNHATNPVQCRERIFIGNVDSTRVSQAGTWHHGVMATVVGCECTVPMKMCSCISISSAIGMDCPGRTPGRAEPT
jgi:hypothetical protein